MTGPFLHRIESAAALISRSVAFLGAWLIIAALLLATLSLLGAVPQSVAAMDEEFGAWLLGNAGATAPDAVSRARPSQLVIPAIGLDATIVFPKNTATEVLNSALARGVAHYPRSAMPGAPGSMILMAHSSALAVVRNPAYRSFNRLHELAAGAAIAIRSGDREHRYRVVSREKTVASTASIALDDPEPRLILFTCNVFGRPEERIIVTAEHVGSYPLPNAARASAADTSSQP